MKEREEGKGDLGLGHEGLGGGGAGGEVVEDAGAQLGGPGADDLGPVGLEELDLVGRQPRAHPACPPLRVPSSSPPSASSFLSSPQRPLVHGRHLVLPQAHRAELHRRAPPLLPSQVQVQLREVQVQVQAASQFQ